MTFAEMLFFVLFIVLIYRVLRPLQRRLEKWIHRRIASKKPASQKPPIDITDYKRNN